MTGKLHKEDVRAKEFGQKLRKLRRQRGHSRQEFARIAGIHYVSLFQWERGKNIKGIMKFFAVCEKLDVQPDYFFKDE